MPWIDDWIEETESIKDFTKEEFEIFSLIKDKWNREDRISLLDSLEDSYGDSVRSALNKFLPEKTVLDWIEIGKSKNDNSLQSFIDTLWTPMKENGFDYTLTEVDRTYKFECTKCPMADLAKEIEGEKWIFELACMSDYYMVEGFNPNIMFKRDKTLITGDSCCNHFYK